MNRRIVVSLVTLGSLVLSLPLLAETVIKLKKTGKNSQAALSIMTKPPPGCKVLKNLELLLCPEGPDLEALQKGGNVDHATPKAEVKDIKLEAIPNDPFFKDQTAMNGSLNGDVQVLDAWNTVTGSPSTIVAIIDSGVTVTHPDLQDNIWKNTAEIPDNGVDDDGNGYVDDVTGYDFVGGSGKMTDETNHGTLIAGVIGAVGNNGVGVSGVNWKVKMMPLKFTDSTGKGSLTAVLQAIEYAIQNKANVINASWTQIPSGEWADKASLLQAAVQKAADSGILFVAAAGNQLETGVGKDIDAEPTYPASLDVDNVLAVAAVDPNGVLSSYSNYGAKSVDLGAPGNGIVSTSSDGSYAQMNGTSIATAFVSGAAALLLSQKSGMTPAEIKKTLMDTVVGDSSLTGKTVTGGHLSIKNALSSLSVPLTTAGSNKTTTTPPPPPSGNTAAPAPAAKGGCGLIP